MVGSGLVNSLAHPGGNTTGVSMLAGDLDGKRQEILIELVPGLRRMGALTDSRTRYQRPLRQPRSQVPKR
jgi:putative tryptophan/tyrosine transport system substrate-binding protein